MLKITELGSITFWSCSVIRFDRPHQTWSTFLLVTIQNLIVSSYCWSYHICCHRSYRNQVGIHSEASSLLARCHSAMTWGKILWTLWVTIMSRLARQVHWGNSGTIVIVTFWVNVRPTVHNETHTWCSYLSQVLVVIVSSGESTAITLLNGRSIKPTSSDL